MKRLIVRLLFAAFLLLFILSPGFFKSEASSSYYNRQVAVLIYHHIDETAQSSVTITPNLFKEQLKFMKEKKYNFISLDEFKRFLSGETVPPNAVLVTFDDGYQSFYTKAFPILDELEIPAVNFVITKDLEDPTSTTLPSLSPNDIETMEKINPSMDFQCHTYGLHQKDVEGKAKLLSDIRSNGERLTFSERANRIIGDTNRCIQDLDSVEKAEHDSYAYPFGMFDEVSVKWLNQAGMHYAFTTENDAVRPGVNPMHIPRLNAGAPYIHPDTLHNMIIYKTAGEIPNDTWIPLAQAVKQSGGFVVQDPEGSLKIILTERVYTIEKGSKIAQAEGKSIEMHAPLKAKFKKNYILAEDLKEILGKNIIYNKATKEYQIR